MPRRLGGALLAGWLVILVAVGLALLARAPADDSYIVARYAHNLLAGNGLTYNPGEHINALTSPAGFAVIAALASYFPDPVRAWQAVAALAVVASTLLLAWRMYVAWPLRLAFVALTLASPFVLLWTVGGLETPLLYVAAASLAAVALSPAPLTRGRLVALVALGALALATRYDAVLFAAPVGLVALWQRRHDAATWVAAALAAALFGAWVLFCAEYFGDVLPTSFYVKLAPAGTAHTWPLGVEYALSFVVLAGFPLALVLRRYARPPTGPAPLRTAVWWGLGLTLAYGLVAGSVHMMYAYRFFVPWLPVAWLALLPRDVPDHARKPTLRVAILVLSAQSLLLAVVWQYSQNPNLSLAYVRQTPGNERHELSLVGARHGAASYAAVRQQAGELRAHWRAQPAATVRAPRAAVDTGGVLPYFVPELYVFDRLVSYRHACANPAEQAADYWQVFRERTATPAAPPAPGWQPVSTHDIAITDAAGMRHDLAIELWFQPSPAGVTLPPTVNGACVPAHAP